jgi:hypothetical protein
MNLDNRLRAILLLPLFVGCSSSHPANGPAGRAGESVRAQPPLWYRYVTITPEQMKAALSAPDCRPAEDDPEGHWGTPWEGLQLSIRLEKEAFTNGEPVVACMTLRNISDRVRFFDVGPYPEEKDTRIVLLRAQERILGEDDPKPRGSFRERLMPIRAGSSPGPVPISPGTQRQFSRDLSKMFDLSVGGCYCAHAERSVINRDSMRWTNLLSGTVTFRILDSQGHK